MRARPALYAEMPAAQGMIGMYAAVANANHMAVWGGADPLLGTNPLAFGVPSGAGPLVLDMATTVVSYGTVKNYALQGKPMQPGWMVNTATGEDIIDAETRRRGPAAADRRLQGQRACGHARADRRPAQPRGVRPRRGRLQRRRFERDQYRALHRGVGRGALPAARGYKAEVDRHIGELKQSKRLPGVDEIRMPGERRRQCREERLRDGVPLRRRLVAQLDKMAGELGGSG